MNLNEFITFVEFIKDVDKYEARVKVIKDENDRLETNIGLTAKIADIPYIKEKTEQNLQESKKILEDAKVEAAATKEKAKGVYDKQLAATQQKAVEAEATLAEGKKALAEAQKLHNTLISDLQAQLADVTKRQAVLDEAQLEVNARLEKLKSVMG